MVELARLAISGPPCVSRRYLAAAILVVLLASGIFFLQAQVERSEPAADDVPQTSHTPIRGALSTVAPSVESSAVVPETTVGLCPSTMTQEEIEARYAKQEEHFQDIAKQLTGSDDVEMVLAAALLLQGRGTTALDALQRASKLAPQSPLVAWNVLRTCRDGDRAECDLARVEANAIRADGDNGAVWMELAMLHLSQDHLDKAEHDVRSAIAAPRFDSYFIDHAQLIERALEAGGNSNYTERMIAGISFSAAMAVSYYKITEHCAKIDALDAVWVDLCQQIGEKMYADGRTLLDQAIGTSLVKIALRHTGDSTRIEEATTREAEFREHYRALIPPVEAQNLLGNDDAVLRRHVEDLATYGELVALTKLLAEVERLKKVDGYDQCNFVNPVAGL